MPSEYVIFYEEFKRQTDKALWIMKPVGHRLCRPLSARGKASSSLIKLAILASGKVPKIAILKTMYARDTSSTPCYSEEGSSTCASMPCVLAITLSRSICIAQDSLGSRTIITITLTLRISVSCVIGRQAPDQRGHQHERPYLCQENRRKVVSR